MRHIVLTTGRFGCQMAAGILEGGANDVVLVGRRRELRPDAAANVEIEAEALTIPYHEIDSVNSEIGLSSLRNLAPDVMWVSWPEMLRSQALSLCVWMIGTHPTDLPQGRGRHPLHWTLAMGLDHATLTFFRLEKGADTGSIIAKRRVPVYETDDIVTLEARVNCAGKEVARDLTMQLLQRVPIPQELQDEKRATYWRKRTPADCMIDPRMSMSAICRLVRSYTTPYPCATLCLDGREYRIKEAESVLSQSWPDWSAHCLGSVLYEDANTIVMRVDDGVVRMTKR